jgi:hypothetical protein
MVTDVYVKFPKAFLAQGFADRKINQKQYYPQAVRAYEQLIDITNKREVRRVSEQFRFDFRLSFRKSPNSKIVEQLQALCAANGYVILLFNIEKISGGTG